MIKTFAQQMRSTAATAFLVAVGACGGGSDDSAPSAAAPPASAPVTALPTSIALNAPAAGIEPGTATSFTSDVPAGSKLAFSWDFGDGSGSSTDAVPSHTYAASGDYDISLTVSNEAGASKTSTIHVSVANASNVKGLACNAPDGAGWCWQRPTPNGNAVNNVFFANASTGWAVGEAGSILKTLDGGAHWTGQVSNATAGLSTARFPTEQVGWALGVDGTLLHSVDGGGHWTPQDFGAGAAFVPSALRALDPKRLLVADPYGHSSSSIDGGENWLVSSTDFEPQLTTPSGAMWSISFYSGVTRSDDLGRSVVTSLGTDVISPSLASFSDDLHGWVLGTTPWNGPSTGGQPVLMRTSDSGAHWQTAAGVPLGAVTYMAFFNSRQGWSVANYSGILRTNDAGDTWFNVQLPADVFSPSFYNGWVQALDASTLWFTWGNGVYLTRDGGTSWKFLSVSSESSSYFYDQPQLQRVDAATLLLQYASRFYRSIDGGTNWHQVLGGSPKEANSKLMGLWFFNAKQGFALSADGFLLHTTDGGANWDRQAVGPQPGCRSSCAAARLQFLSATQGWMLLDGQASQTSDGGRTWTTPLTSTLPGPLSDLHFVDIRRGWGVVNNGNIYATSDGGVTWTLSSAPAQAYSSVRFANASLGLAVGPSGRIARTIDGGATWSSRASATRQDFTRVAFVDADTAWAIGNNGAVSRSGDGGATWTQLPVPTSVGLHDIGFADGQHGWIVGDGGTVLATSDGGVSWAVQPSGSVKALYGVFAIDTRTAWVAGEAGSILATATGGSR